MSNPNPEKTINILLTEDNPGDVRLAKEAMKRAQLRANVSVATDGEEALAFLRRQGEFANAVRPSLVLLDLNLPGKNGRAVLREIKDDPSLGCIPVVVLTSSDAHEDIVTSYKLHASTFITKPLEITRYTEVMRAMAQYWLDTAKLPESCNEKRNP